MSDNEESEERGSDNENQREDSENREEEDDEMQNQNKPRKIRVVDTHPNIEDEDEGGRHYDIEVNAYSDKFPFKDCNTMDIKLYPHEELSLEHEYTNTFLSSNRQYVALLGKSKNNEDDIVYIWNMNDIYNKIHVYNEFKMHGVSFAPKNDSFIIEYLDKAPGYYSIKSGKRISKLQNPPTLENEEDGKICCSSFSPKGRYYAIGYKGYFVVWEVLKGKKILEYEIKSELKFFRNKTLCSITDEDKVIVTRIERPTENTPENKDFPLKDEDGEDLSYKDILDGVVSNDGEKLLFSTDKAIYSMNLNNGSVEKVQEYNRENISKVFLSEDLTQSAATDLRKIYFYNLNEEENYGEPIGTLLKEDFTGIEVNFETNMLLTVDDIGVNITDYGNENSDEQFIYFNENVSRFHSFSFAPGFKNLLAIIDEHNAIIYDTVTGRIIKQFRNNCDKWAECCILAPQTSEIAIAATKSTKDEVKIWNYKNGNDVSTLPDFDVASLCFNESATHLAGGAKKGKYCARVWEIESGDYVEYKAEDGYAENTKVFLTRRYDTDLNTEREILIAVGQNQYPIVFDMESSEKIFKCNDGNHFDVVDEIECNPEANVFLVQGHTHKNYTAYLYNLKNGETLRQFKNSSNVEIAKQDNYLLCKSSNYNNNKLFILKLDDVDNLGEPINCDVGADFSGFLQGSRSLVSVFGVDDKIVYEFNDPEDGEKTGALEITKKSELYTEMDVSADVNKEQGSNPDNAYLTFRYLELQEKPYRKNFPLNFKLEEPNEGEEGEEEAEF